MYFRPTDGCCIVSEGTYVAHLAVSGSVRLDAVEHLRFLRFWSFLKSKKSCARKDKYGSRVGELNLKVGDEFIFQWEDG